VLHLLTGVCYVGLPATEGER